MEKVSNELRQSIGKECTLKVKVNKKGYIQELTAIKVYHVERKVNHIEADGNNNNNKRKKEEVKPDTTTTSSTPKKQKPER